LSEINMAPDFGPFFRRLRNILQSFAERVGGGLVVFLVEERFAHAEIGERAPGLDAERFLVLCDGVVKAASFGEILASGTGLSSAQRDARFENDVVWIDFDAEWLGLVGKFERKLRFKAGKFDGHGFRVALCID